MLDQIGMPAAFDDATVLHDADQIGLADGRQAVSDHDHGAALDDMFERFLELRLGVAVERAGRLVEQHDRRLAEHGAGKRDALLLAARQVHATLADLIVIAAG